MQDPVVVPRCQCATREYLFPWVSSIMCRGRFAHFIARAKGRQARNIHVSAAGWQHVCNVTDTGGCSRRACGASHPRVLAWNRLRLPNSPHLFDGHLLHFCVISSRSVCGGKWVRGSRGQTAICHFSCSTEEGRDGDGAEKDTMKEPGSPRKVRLGAVVNPSLRTFFQETPACYTSVSTNTSGS